MTEKQFQEIVARQAQPPLGTSSQVRTDMAELISEITRRTTAGDAAFEPEPGEEQEDVFATALGRELLDAEKKPKKGAKR